MNSCMHDGFEADCFVTSMVPGNPNSPVYIEVKVKCGECGLPFQFISSRLGFSSIEPHASLDRLTLRCPIEPLKESKPKLELLIEK